MDHFSKKKASTFIEVPIEQDRPRNMLTRLLAMIKAWAPREVKDGESRLNRACPVKGLGLVSVDTDQPYECLVNTVFVPSVLRDRRPNCDDSRHAAEIIEMYAAHTDMLRIMLGKAQGTIQLVARDRTENGRPDAKYFQDLADDLKETLDIINGV